MKTIGKYVGAVLLVSGVATTPALAQSTKSAAAASDSPKTEQSASTGQSSRTDTITTENRAEDKKDWGWIGLLGLAGLLGLRRREHHDVEVRNRDMNARPRV